MYESVKTDFLESFISDVFSWCGWYSVVIYCVIMFRNPKNIISRALMFSSLRERGYGAFGGREEFT
jgi:hypothetical protein